jgi:hypothetical protein
VRLVALVVAGTVDAVAAPVDLQVLQGKRRMEIRRGHDYQRWVI